MLENSFIKFFQKPDDGIMPAEDCRTAVLVHTDYPLQFFTDYNDIAQIGGLWNIASASGYQLPNEYVVWATTRQTDSPHFTHISVVFNNRALHYTNCFRLMYEYTNNGNKITLYSNLLRIAPTKVNQHGETVMDGCIAIAAACRNYSALGFPWQTKETPSQYLQAYFRARLHSPALIQTSTTYEHQDGTTRVLATMLRREYEFETDFLDQNQHLQLQTMLACDIVKVDGSEMYMEGEYKIDWDNGYDNEDGVRLAKATTKLRTQNTAKSSDLM